MTSCGLIQAIDNEAFAVIDAADNAKTVYCKLL